LSELELPDDDSGLGEAQRASLPAVWRTLDRVVVTGTEMITAVIGILFALLIGAEVASRFLLDFSISYVNAAARMLLVWFFLLGAGLALRQGAHVGFTLVVDALSGPARFFATAAARISILAFCLLLLWSGILATVAAVDQTDPGLGISQAYGVAALPVGALLLVYNLAVLSWPPSAVRHAVPAERA
jgi:TRAP-type C4-dicarboxylate transport system permease small subunit